MNRRPWPLILLALFQVLSPFANVLYNAIALKVPVLQVIFWIFDQSPLRLFEYVFLMPIAGIAIYAMKGWSYPVFFLAMGWSASTHFRYRSNISESYPLTAILVAYGLDAVLVLYLLLPRVRKTYLDPTVRWWETQPRYELNAPVSTQMNGQIQEGLVLNISEGGAFIQTSTDFQVGKELTLEMKVMGKRFSARATVVDATSISGVQGFRVRYLHDDTSSAEFSQLIRGLKALGFQERGGPQGGWQGFRDWALTLLKTGRGLLPNPKSRAAPRSG